MLEHEKRKGNSPARRNLRRPQAAFARAVGGWVKVRGCRRAAARVKTRRRHHLHPAQARGIVIQTKQRIGDVIWRLPFIRAIAATAPGGIVTFLTGSTPGGRALLPELEASQLKCPAEHRFPDTYQPR
jgi:hypothetical protein